MSVLNEAQVREISRYPRQVIRNAIAKMPPSHPFEGYYEKLAHTCESLYRSRLGLPQEEHEDQGVIRQRLADVWCSNPINEFASILGQIWKHGKQVEETYSFQIAPIPFHLVKKYRART